METVFYFTTGDYAEQNEWTKRIESLGYTAGATAVTGLLSQWPRSQPRPHVLVLSLERLGDHVIDMAEQIYYRSEWQGVDIVFVGGTVEIINLAASKFFRAKWLPLPWKDEAKWMKDELARALREPFSK